MTLPTHLLAGLIIGNVTGNYPVALAGSLLMDVDHAVSLYRHHILFKPRKLLRTELREADPWHDQRNFLHSIFSWAVISALLLSINFELGRVFSIGYFFHLVIDALDHADFWPLFPLRRYNIRGFIGYDSKQEVVFALCLALVLLVLLVN